MTTTSVNLISIDLNCLEEIQPQARFKVTAFSGNSVIVNGSAITNNSLNIVNFSATINITNTDELNIPLPKTTCMVKLVISFPSIKISKCYPEDKCSFNFDRLDLDLFLTTNFCNSLCLDTVALDHTPVVPPDTRTAGHQAGPTRASRALAMVHLAMMEAYIIFNGRYNSYLQLSRLFPNAISLNTLTKMTMLQATVNTLINLYPSHSTRLNGILEPIMTTFPNNTDKTLAALTALNISLAVIQNRTGDGSNYTEKIVGVNYIPSNSPGEWRKDPLSSSTVALGVEWGNVRPFVLTSGSQFRCAAPPSLTSDEYMMSFDDVKSNGGNGTTTLTTRSVDKTEVGLFWAYDGAAKIGVPPRLYNQVGRKILYEQNKSAHFILRALTLLNIAMADSAICCWESKYFYKFWRPTSAIRESDTGTGPSNLGDGNTKTSGDANWSPLGAPATNSSNTNFCPNFPSAPSGHATFGGALFQILRRLLGSDNIQFSFVSDELNGITTQNGQIRPYRERTFKTLTQAEEENGESRIYLGIHFTFEKVFGILMGNRVADYVFSNIFV